MSHWFDALHSMRRSAARAIRNGIAGFVLPVASLLTFVAATSSGPFRSQITFQTAMQFEAQYGVHAKYSADLASSNAASLREHRASSRDSFISFYQNFFLWNSFQRAIEDYYDLLVRSADNTLNEEAPEDSTKLSRDPRLQQPPRLPGGMQPPQPGGFVPPGGVNQPGFNPPPAMGGTPDSIPIPKRPPSDSTARVKFLTHEKKFNPIADPFPERLHTLFAEPKGGIKREVRVDTATNTVHVRETLNGKNVRVPLDLPLSEYIRLRYEYERYLRTRAFIDKNASKPKDELGSIFKNLTEIEIPVPENPLMSIFGNRNVVSLRITGSVDINAGFRSEKSDQQTVFLNPTQITPTFKQQVNVNVNGMIGDKLSVTADWSTERAFEYENQLKIQYKGYEDEIIQNIEAGNVALQTPSALVGGSGALFGIKGDFQFGPLKLTAIASQKKGEGSRLSISGGAQTSSFEKHAYQYDEKHFFIDTSYAGQVYENYYNYQNITLSNGTKAIAPLADSRLYIKDIEVWITPPTSFGVVIDPLAREAVALIRPDMDIAGNPAYPAQYQGYIDPNQTVLPAAGQIEVGKFKKMTKDVDYFFNEVTGILSINQSVQEDQVLAVAYRTQGLTTGSDDDAMYGTFVNDTRLTRQSFTDDKGQPIPPRLVLKLVKPRNLNPSFRLAWRQQVRSIFSLGARNIKPEDIKSIEFVVREGGQQDKDEIIDGIPFLQMFGVDNGNDAGGTTGDGHIDQNFIDPVRGLLYLPTTRPWDSGLSTFAKLKNIDASVYSRFLYPDVYDTTQVIARQRTERDKIILVGSIKGASSATYQLGFNLVPGSVRVYLNGQALVPGADYQVDEISGMVTIRKEEALIPGAKVDIDYERRDLFSFASKTMLGARGEMNLSKETSVGFTLLNLNQKTLSDKVRIGEEPLNNTILGVDAKTKVDLPFLTDALNRLPFISTNEKSYLSIQGEAAYMMPNPNTKASPIPSDNGAGIAYIDDFEGSRLFAPLQTAYSIWKMASVPANHVLFAEPGNQLGLLVDSVMQSHRARLNWYNLPITQSNVGVTQIWPNRKAALEYQKVNVLELDYRPGERGMYNYSPSVRDTMQRSWAGVMRLLPLNAYNLVDGNYNFIEIWMKIESPQRTGKIAGKMMIDIGKLSEDVIANRKLDSEDLVIPGSIANGILNPGEDIGLDMMNNDEERAAHAADIAKYGALYPDLQSDPSNDDYVYNTSNWSHFNGTEGNIKDISGQFPDTEDLNSNSILDLNNDYFQYEVDLDTTQAFRPGSYIVGGGFPNDSWFQFRIPITDYKRIIGSPSFTDVQYIRVWLTDVPDSVLKVRIADFNLIGNQWIERIKADSTLRVSVVNIEDNPEYSSPPGVIRPRDRTRPDQDILGNEQSLALIFRGLEETFTREAVRYFPSGIDLFNYKRMKMFVHGDADNPYVNATNYAAEVVLRMGIDTSNYYEYRQPIRTGWDALNEVDIDFGLLTSIKPLRKADTVITKIDSVRFDTSYVYRSTDVPVGNASGSIIRVIGRPDLIRVNFISVGVRNPDNDYPTGRITGEVWINELRVTDVKDQSGFAYQGSLSLRLADFADISATMSYSDPYFHGLAERFKGDRSYTTNWSATATVNVDRALPKEWNGSQIRVTYSHAENLRKPLLLPGEPDVEVDRTVEQRARELERTGSTQREVDYQSNKIRIGAQTFEVRDSWAIPSVRLKVPGESWLATDVANKIELSYNYSITRSRDPVLEQRRQWQWTARAGYSLDLSRENYFSPFKAIFKSIPILQDYRDLKIYYAPNRVGLNAEMTRTRDEKKDRSTGRLRPYERSFEHGRGMTIGYQLSENGLLNLGGTYSSAIRTSLLKLETDPTKVLSEQQRQSSEIFRDIFFGRNGLYFGEPISYDQQLVINSRPMIPRLFDLDRYLDITWSYSVSFHWQMNLQQAELGRAVGYNASFNSQFNFKLKSLFDPLFAGVAGSSQSGPSSMRMPRRTQTGQEEMPPDMGDAMTEPAQDDTTKAKSQRMTFGRMLGKLAYYLIKWPLLDYENIGITYNQATTSAVSGVRGMTGFTTFWTTGLTNPRTDPELGASRFYQLGFTRTPNPTSERLAFRSSFPFITIETSGNPGYRAANNSGSYVDNFAQNNTLNFKTNRDIFEGIKIDLGWDVKWSVNKNTQISTDLQTGQPLIQSELTSSSIERSYLMFPDFLFFSLFKTNMTTVAQRFSELKTGDPSKTSDHLAQAFEEGFEAAPFLAKYLGGMMPRVNWGIRWEGIEKLPLLSKLADRISMEHRYKSSIATKMRSNIGEQTIIESKRVQYDFSPLLGVTLGFNKLWGGDLSVNGSWRTQSSYDLNTSANNIVQSGQSEVSVTANFRKTGFDFPLFGIHLKNDLDVSLAFSTSKSESYTYQLNLNELDPNGQPREGMTKITLEPRVRYVISQRVTASLFYRYQRTKPDAAVGSRVPGTTIHEGGLEIRLSITGS